MTGAAFESILEHGSPRVAAAIVLASFLAGSWLTRRDSRDWPLTPAKKTGVHVAVLLAGLLGCAIPAFLAGDVIGAITSFEWRGPKTILGGLLGGFAGASIFKALARISYDTSDAFARGTCLMLALGRLGCVARHCCFGIEVPAPFGCDLGDGVARFPVQFVEAAVVFGLFLVLNHLHRRGLAVHRRFFIFLLGYGLIRFTLEFFREQVAGGWLGLGFYQWLALATAGIGAIQILKRAPGALPAPVEGMEGATG